MHGYKLLSSVLLSLAIHSLLFYSPSKNQESKYRVNFRYSKSSVSSQGLSKKTKGKRSNNNSSLSGVTQEARPNSPISPIYPELSRAYKEEGLVIISVELDENGNIIDAKIKKSSGHDRLDKEALKTVLASKFQSSTHNGITEASQLDLEFNFQLNP